MGDYKKRLVKPTSALLDVGESILAATPCLTRGGITRRAVGAGVGVFGGTLGAAVAAGSAGALGRQRVGPTSLPSIMALGVTERRLVVCGMNRFTGHPNKVVWWTTLEQVKGVRSLSAGVRSAPRS